MNLIFSELKIVNLKVCSLGWAWHAYCFQDDLVQWKIPEQCLKHEQSFEGSTSFIFKQNSFWNKCKCKYIAQILIY